MKLPKEMEGRFTLLLMEGIAVQEVKIVKIMDDEVICKYQDDEEVHIATEFLRAWWPDKKREKSHAKGVKAGKAAAHARACKDLPTKDLMEEGTNTQAEEKD